MVGECRGKKFGCKLGALQRAFREPVFLQQGGDALMPKLDVGVASYDGCYDGGAMGACLWSSFLLFSLKYVRYFMVFWCRNLIRFLMLDIGIMSF